MHACAYYLEGDQIHQFKYEKNEYNYMFAYEYGTVFGNKKMNLRENAQKPFIQIFKEEVLENQVGVAIQIKGMNNAGVTIVEGCIFNNNVGSLGGSIHIEQGGALISLNNFFAGDYKYLVVPPEFEKIVELKYDREVHYLG